MTLYDWFLLVGVLYTGIGSDVMLNWGAGLITGKRLRPDAPNWFERMIYKAHAVNDPNMRAIPPIDGREDKIPAWNHALAVANGTIVVALEVLIVIGLLTVIAGNPVPDAARLAAFAWLMRSVWGELSYWHVLTHSPSAPLRGRALVWYWIIGMPQAFLPFLVAERFYPGTAAYDFNPLRFAAFLAVPIALMAIMRISYRGRVW